MLRSSGLLVLAVLPPSLQAQEPRHPEPVRVERSLEPGDLPMSGRIQILMSRRARLGISANMRMRETDSIGVLIQAVAPNGPAAQAGLRSGDIITHLNGQPLVVPDPTVPAELSLPGLRLQELVSSLEPGDSVSVQFRRGTTRKTVLVVAGEEPVFPYSGPDGPMGYVTDGDGNTRVFTFNFDPASGIGVAGDDTFRLPVEGPGVPPPGGSLPKMRFDSLRMRERSRFPPPMMFMEGSPLADLELAPLNRDLGRYFGTTEGVLVIDVPANSRLGLKPGDVVLQVNGRIPTGPVHLLRILRSYDPGEAVRLEIMRMKKRMTIVGQAGER